MTRKTISVLSSNPDMDSIDFPCPLSLSALQYHTNQFLSSPMSSPMGPKGNSKGAAKRRAVLR